MNAHLSDTKALTEEMDGKYCFYNLPYRSNINQFLTENGFGRIFSDPKKLSAIINTMLTHKHEKQNLEKMSLGQREVTFLNAIEELTNHSSVRRLTKRLR